MSDLLEAAAESLGIPPALVQRSAAARAEANGASVDDVLAAWAGNGSVAAAPPPTEEAEEEAPPPEETTTEEETPEETTTDEAAAEAPSSEPEPAPQTAPEMEPSFPVVETIEPEPEEDLEPVPIGVRVKTAARIGAWAGAALGVVGFMTAVGFWGASAAAPPDSGPVVQVEPTSLLVLVALVSVVFGTTVAALSRAGAAWTNPAMQLQESKSGTAWIGGGIGLALGLIGGAVLRSGFGSEVEGTEGLVELPVLALLGVLVLGGAVLGAITAAVPQILGTPVTVTDSERDEVPEVKNRLSIAMSLPMAGAALLALLVLPFAYALISSNHLFPNGAAIIAILTSAGILGFASLAGNRPQVRISVGDFVVAIVGIGTVLLILVTVLLFVGQDTEHDEEEAETTATVLVL